MAKNAVGPVAPPNRLTESSAAGEVEPIPTVPSALTTIKVDVAAAVEEAIENNVLLYVPFANA